MNTVLDVLRLRRVRLDYVSPPVCEVIFSGSGASVMLEAVEAPAAPFDLRFSGQCERFLTWSTQTPVTCTSLYSAVDPNDPLTKYVLVADCVPTGSVNVCSPGLWQYSTLLPDGTESVRSTPVEVGVGERVTIPIVLPIGAVRFNLFRNPDISDPSGAYPLVLSTTASGVFEVCDTTGCYRLQSISADGASELSAPVCNTIPTGCIPDAFADVLCPEPLLCVGIDYSSQFEAVGGTEPYLWELLSGNVPSGVILHTGLFTGNTAPINGIPIEPGVFDFTVRVTSASGTFKEKSCALDVLGVVEYGAVPDGTTDTAYSAQLTAAGGTAPYSFAIVSGALPSGYSMDAAGLVTGTAYFPEIASFGVEVTDATGRKCTTLLTLEVVACPTATVFPIINWNHPTGGNTWATEMVFDTKRRQMIVQLSNNFPADPGATFGLDVVSSITKTFVSEHLDTGGGNTFGTASIAYDPVHDIVAIASRTANWTRFDPNTGLFANVGAQSPQIGEDNTFHRLAVDTKRGHVMGVAEGFGVTFGAYQIVEITDSTFTSLTTATPVAGKYLWTACYNELSDKFVVLIKGNNPPFCYVDPVSYAVTLSTVNRTEGGSPGHRIYSLPGTPWVVFADASARLVFTDTLTDTEYWYPTEIIGITSPPTPDPSIEAFSYNTCSGILTVHSFGFLTQFHVPSKTYLSRGNDPTSFTDDAYFDQAANLTYELRGASPEPTHSIYTI